MIDLLSNRYRFTPSPTIHQTLRNNYRQSMFQTGRGGVKSGSTSGSRSKRTSKSVGQHANLIAQEMNINIHTHQSNNIQADKHKKGISNFIPLEVLDQDYLLKELEEPSNKPVKDQIEKLLGLCRDVNELEVEYESIKRSRSADEKFLIDLKIKDNEIEHNSRFNYNCM
jgi:hypothetical protein